MADEKGNFFGSRLEIVGLLLMVMLLISVAVLVRTNRIDSAFFWVIAIFMGLYVVAKPAVPLIYAYIFKPSQIKMGAVKAWKDMMLHLGDEITFAVPIAYKPHNMTYFPHLDMLLFEINEADMADEEFSYVSRPPYSKWAGIYSLSAHDLIDRRRDADYYQIAADLMRWELALIKGESSKVVLPTLFESMKAWSGQPLAVK